MANKACAIDLKDSQSWCKYPIYLNNLICFLDTLGNAHLTNFFNNNESTEQLELALKAYAQSEKWMKIGNPDLFCNRATILEYLERYSEAIRDYTVAHSIDQSL